jgi:hypothetical protein
MAARALPGVSVGRHGGVTIRPRRVPRPATGANGQAEPGDSGEHRVTLSADSPGVEVHQRFAFDLGDA